MKKTFIFIAMLMAFLAVSTSCSNEAKEKYQTQKAYVDSLQKANQQQINDAKFNGSKTAVINAELECYGAEVIALDSLRNLAKEAYGDNSAEYQESYDRYKEAKEAKEKASKEGIEILSSINKYVNGL